MKKIIFIYLTLILSIPLVHSQESFDELIMQGIEYHDEGNYAKAIEYYKKALKINPASAEVFYELSLSLLESGDYYGAIEYSDKLIDRDDKYAILAYNVKGSSLNYLGKSEEAIDVFLECIGKEENYGLTYYNLGLAYYANKELQNARDAYIHSVERDPQHASSHLNLGITMLELDKRVEGLLCLYYYLLLEPKSDRSLKAYDTLLLSLNQKRNRNEQIKTHVQDVFITVDSLLSVYAETIPLTKAHKNEVEQFTELTDSFFKSFGNQKDDSNEEHAFWWEFYIPFFKSMALWGYTDIYCHYIRLSAHEIPEAWISVNQNRIRDFNAWLRRQE